MAQLRIEERLIGIPSDEVEVIDPDGDVILQLQKILHTEESITSQSPSEPDDHQEPEAHTMNNAATDGRAHELEREGDLVLERTVKIDLRVSSRHLMLASQVFHAMLDANKFAEGNTLRSQGSLTIPLEDDPETLIILMHIVHGMTRKVPRFVALDTLTKLAKLVDYYRLHEVVELFSDTWVASLQEEAFPQSYTPDVVPWLFISWVFHKEDAFLKLTKILICECDSKSIDDIDYEDIPIPLPITTKIQEYRINAIGTVLTVLYNYIATYSTATIICSRGAQACDANMLGSLIKSSAVAEIWPPPDAPYHDISFNSLAIQVQEMQIFDICTRGDRYNSFSHGVRDTIQASLSSVEDQFQGLCLDSFLPRSQTSENKGSAKVENR
ncbi:hypothetical protein PVAG01_06967 [Phlyctema vagabunda]|uniref:BTB domain-containing protein n=1 Tax=Phlyctema vagabunda TaxID=108571 RepID=A0ABR4PB53_9HELO